MRSEFGIAARLELGTLLAWCAGVFAAGVMFGVIAKITTADLPDSLRDTLDEFGVHGTFAAQYFGVAFLLVATVVCAAACRPSPSRHARHRGRST